MVRVHIDKMINSVWPDNALRGSIINKRLSDLEDIEYVVFFPSVGPVTQCRAPEAVGDWMTWSRSISQRLVQWLSWDDHYFSELFCCCSAVEAYHSTHSSVCAASTRHVCSTNQFAQWKSGSLGCRFDRYQNYDAREAPS